MWKCPKCQTGISEESRFCSHCGASLSFSEDETIRRTKTLEMEVDPFSLGTHIAGRYQIIEELGAGGMGKVFKVLDTEINEKIALKLIKPEIARDGSTIERFRNELKISRNIAHKNVCRMYHIGETEGIHYITMEYVSGEDLKNTLKRVGPLSSGKAIIIAKQICQGLSEAHSHGVVHRDLKPSNIMLDVNGNVRIMDFGIARTTKSKGVTETGMVVGTPDYMSPEQAEGKGIDQRADLYSFGIILYEMVTGHVPFTGDTPMSIALKHMTEHPPDPRNLNEQIPNELSRLIMKCLEKSREKRFQTAEEILDELERIENDLPTTSKVMAKRRTTFSPFQIRSPYLKFFLIFVFISVAILGLGYLNRDKIFKKVELSTTVPDDATLSLGTLKIESTPSSADIYIDGESKGLTPIGLELPPGRYIVEIKKEPDYSDIRQEVEVRAGEETTKNLMLEKIPAPPPASYSLKVSSKPPGAAVKINGRFQGTTPLDLKLESDSCRIQIDNGEGWSSVDERIELKSGVNPFYRELKRILYSLQIDTNPPEAMVFIDDKFLGISPQRTSLQPGIHKIRIEKEGFSTHEEGIQIQADVAKEYKLQEPSPGRIRFKVHPYANVFIDDAFIAEVPPIKILSLSEGKHNIKFISTRLDKEYSVEVEILPGEGTEVFMNMETGESRIVQFKEEK